MTLPKIEIPAKLTARGVYLGTNRAYQNEYRQGGADAMHPDKKKSREERIDNHVIGTLGEIAFCLYAGIPVVDQLTGPGAIDCELPNGRGVEVKTASYYGKTLQVSKACRVNHNGRITLIWFIDGKRWEEGIFYVIGWDWADIICLPSNLNKRNQYEVPQRDLVRPTPKDFYGCERFFKNQ